MTAPAPFTYLTIKARAQEDRPREKLIAKGALALSAAELLALLIGSGVQRMNAVDLAQHLLASYDHRLHCLARCSVAELQRFKGIGLAKATLIVGMMELAKRLAAEPPIPFAKVHSPEEGVQLLKARLAHQVVESFWVVLLSRANRVLKVLKISQGGISSTTVDPTVVFHSALLHHASKLLLAHNHPGGNPMPSDPDQVMTQKIVEGANSLGLEVVDHLILTDHDYFSFANHGIMPPSKVG